MKQIILFVIISVLSLSCNRQVVKDAERMAELFCKQNKIITESQDIHSAQVQKELEKIDKEVQQINDNLQKEYSKDIDAMEIFAKTYQEGIRNCK